MDAYASQEKLRCLFYPWEPTPLDVGLRMTAGHVKDNWRTNGFKPTGYTRIEVSKNMPPSWKQWLEHLGGSFR